MSSEIDWQFPEFSVLKNSNFAEIKSLSWNLCGDALLKDNTEYPLKIYPLYIQAERGYIRSSSETELSPDLQVVRAFLCDKANMGFITDVEEDTINERRDVAIVGYFINQARANQALKIASKKLSSLKTENPLTAHVGEYLELNAAPPSLDIITQQAKLTKEQAQVLLSIDHYTDIGITFDVILPTYLPNQFELQLIEVGERADLPTYISQDLSDQLIKVLKGDSFAPMYKVNYQTPDNSCFFSLSGTVGWGGADPKDLQYAEVNSPIFGRFLIKYINFDQISKEPIIDSDYLILATKLGSSQVYSFSSYGPGCKNIISLSEAIKIIESVQYLRHPLYRISEKR
ncbi:MAG: hypothetical protein AAFN93_18495 [Bacteroidota bacterium]